MVLIGWLVCPSSVFIQPRWWRNSNSTNGPLEEKSQVFGHKSVQYTMIRVISPHLRSRLLKGSVCRRKLSTTPSSSPSGSQSKSTDGAREVLKTQGIGTGKSSPSGMGGYIKDRGALRNDNRTLNSTYL